MVCNSLGNNKDITTDCIIVIKHYNKKIVMKKILLTDANKSIDIEYLTMDNITYE